MMWKSKESIRQPQQRPEDLPNIANTSTLPNDETNSAVSNILLRDSHEVLEDGRVAVDVDPRLANVLADFIETSEDEPPPAYSNDPILGNWTLPLNIVIQVVGDRDDVQPFLALGQELQRSGHRVRLATHAIHRELVRSASLEFYSIAKSTPNPMGYIFKTSTLDLQMDTSRKRSKQEMIREILDGCWASCLAPDPDSKKPFVANAIIANPLSIAHIHCAQALGIPVHIVSTMPWSPTRAFPHPLTKVQSKDSDFKLASYLSYKTIQMSAWNSIGSIMQVWRRSIDLQEVPLSEAPFLMETLRIPHAYCWSPAVLPKPKDWGKHIDVCGYLFQNQSSVPLDNLDTFLRSGDCPIYIGFGSTSIQNPGKFLRIISDVLWTCNTRAIISKTLYDKGIANDNNQVFFLDSEPDDWLFRQVSVVIHHGETGITARGLLNGCPTVIVSFSGVQVFWGNVIAQTKAGSPTISFKGLQTQQLVEALRYCLTEEASKAATSIAKKLKAEDGIRATVDSFHRQLSIQDMTCDLNSSYPAVWEYTKAKTSIKLSGIAAQILLGCGRIKSKDLRLYRPKPINIENRRWDPLSGALSAYLGLNYNLVRALSGLWRKPQALRKRMEMERAICPKEGVTQTDYDDKLRPSAPLMVGASVMTIFDIPSTAIKGAFVDIPVALAEGMRNAPRLYGEYVPEHEPVTSWKSGVTVAGQSFARQMGEGLTDLFVQPARGLAKDGALGFGKGLAKGVLQTATKPSAAVLGLVGYTSQGIYKSVHSGMHSKVQRMITNAQLTLGKYSLDASGSQIDKEEILRNFNKVVYGDAEELSNRIMPFPTRTSTTSSQMLTQELDSRQIILNEADGRNS